MIKFTVPGNPVAKGRARSFRRGNFIGHYTPQKTEVYENLVKMCAMDAMRGHKKIAGAASVLISLFFQIPSSWSKKKRLQALSGEIRPIVRPDIDNCTKALFDSINGIVWDDDKQAIEVIVRKFYSANPRAVVSVEPF